MNTDSAQTDSAQVEHDLIRASGAVGRPYQGGTFDAAAVRAADFEMFNYHNPRRIIYLDTAASAQKPFAVLYQMRRFMMRDYANVHRGSYAVATEITSAYEKARMDVARFIGAPSHSVVFTANATMALNLVAYSYARTHLKPGQSVVISQMDHHANLVPWQQLSRAHGLVLKTVRVLADGSYNMEELETHLRGGGVGLVCVTHASNVLGTINPIAQITTLCHQHGAKVVVDGAQAVVHQNVDVTSLGVDFYAFSGHKLYGPTGIGVLYGKPDLLDAMPPMITGGEMVEKVTLEEATFQPPPLRFEAGTPPFLEAIGLAAAVKYVQHHQLTRIDAHEQALLALLFEGLAEIPSVKFYGPPVGVKRVPLVAFNLGHHHPLDVASVLEAADNICVRVGHHCAMPLMHSLGIRGSLRVSLGLYNLQSDVERLLAALRRAESLLNDKVESVRPVGTA